MLPYKFLTGVKNPTPPGFSICLPYRASAMALRVLGLSRRYTTMGYETFSVFSAVISLECTILLLGATLFLDYRRSLRRQWLLRHLESILRSDPEPDLVDLPEAA